MIVRERFNSLKQWSDYASANPIVYREPEVTKIGLKIKEDGFKEPLTGRFVSSVDLAGQANNWREGLAFNGFNSRMRAVMLLIEELTSQMPAHEVRMYGAEAITSLAHILRGRFARYYGSEYAGNQAEIDYLFPIPHQDLTSLSLPSNSFDFATTNEVLEHVPDIDAALGELARILKTGGVYFGTMPFGFTLPVGVKKASLVGGKIEYHSEPEYHGNPISPEAGSLVFEIPGCDIIERAKSAGFSEVHMEFIASSPHGILTENLGVFVMYARK